MDSHGAAGAAKVLEARAALPDWADYDALLREIVRGKRVDYEKARAKRVVLDQVLAAVAKTNVEKVDKVALLALYINAYNAATIKLVLDHVIVEGGPDLAGVLEVEKAGGIKFFDSKQVIVAGELLSLNELESKGRDLGDPRIHFAVNCASVSCPPLMARVWSPESMEADLDAATKAYLSSPEGLAVRDGRVFLSKIFEWYAKDWGGSEGVKNFLHLHAPERAKEFLANELGYLEYDWNLNSVR